MLSTQRVGTKERNFPSKTPWFSNKNTFSFLNKITFLAFVSNNKPLETKRKNQKKTNKKHHDSLPTATNSPGPNRFRPCGRVAAPPSGRSAPGGIDPNRASGPRDGKDERCGGGAERFSFFFKGKALKKDRKRHLKLT